MPRTTPLDQNTHQSQHLECHVTMVDLSQIETTSESRMATGSPRSKTSMLVPPSSSMDLPSTSTSSGVKILKNNKYLHPKAQLWRSKLQYFTDLYKVGFIVYSAHC